MLSLYQAERTRAEEQLQQKDDQIQQNVTELGQARTQLQQKTTELDSVQQSFQVLTDTVKFLLVDVLNGGCNKLTSLQGTLFEVPNVLSHITL